MKKCKDYLLLMSLFLIPSSVLASSGVEPASIITAILMEAFISIHMSAFVLSPLSQLISENNSKKIFRTLFTIRAGVLLFFDFFYSMDVAYIDFICLIVGIFTIYPIFVNINRKKEEKNKLIINSVTSKNTLDQTETEVGICSKCGGKLESPYKYCGNCGAKVEIQQTTEIQEKEEIIASTDFDSIYTKSEDELLEEFINKEIQKANFENNSKLIPKEILKRKTILNIIFAILLFISVSLIFFHFPVYTYIIALIFLFIFLRMSLKYDLMSYLKKESKSRPDEKITNIVMITKESLVYDNLKLLRIFLSLVAIIVPLIIFKDPKILYEKQDNGYAVRFYTFGWNNYKTVTIPEMYKNEKIISLRGNAFSNMPFLESVILPDTITEIRGQAFKNDFKLVSVNIPKNLEYLGGGSFYNCKSIKRIEFPDTLTYMGGEIFYSASSLTDIKLSSNLKEIRGDSFENCISLERITIPDKVERIGGHAFYGDTNLEEVVLTENSNLKEIGSSAFRKCDNLNSITIPSDTYVNERAFKESPTTVRHFGQIDYGNTIDSSKYKYSSFMLLDINQKEKVNEYNTYTKVKDAYLELESIDVLEDGNQFNLKYINGNEEISFTLSKVMPYKEINNDLVVEVSSEYSFLRTSNVPLDIYYN